MKNYALLLFSISALSCSTSRLPAQVKLADKNAVIKQMDDLKEKYAAIAHEIWGYAELGYLEQKSTTLLQATLRDAGFEVKAGVANIPTAFVATYGSGKPVIGILAEFDALPGISQEAVPYKSEREGCTAGHACGHHLFGTASVASGIAIKEWLDKNKVSGTIQVFGTPAEEGGSGKVYMARAGLFENVDAMLNWHPGSSNNASAGSCLAIKSAKFKFHGVSAHAAGAPHRGRSALDGVEAMNNMANLMREHVPQETRIHYVITKGGEAPNVVPAEAEVYYYIRHPEMREVKAIFERLVKCANGAAMGTETTVDYEVIGGAYNLLPNATLAAVMNDNLKIVGGVSYTPDEINFANKVIESYSYMNVKPEDAEKVEEFVIREQAGPYSTDVGDVSWLVPTTGLSTATWVPGTSAHSWQAVAAGGTSIGHKGMMVAAKTMALAAIDIYNEPSITIKARAELIRRQGDDFKYEALLGDREAPLDYRLNN
jgi:aminobenzoyl-glutamate utilization protein B